MSTPLIGLPLIGIGMTEWIIIGAAILLFFGATKLPKLGKGLGEGIRNFKDSVRGEEKSAAGDREQPPTKDTDDA